jgi:Flp pilus assembly protein TadG
MRNRQQGVALVEFAFVLPLLLVLSLVSTELGRAVYRYNTTAKAVRDAVRYLSVQTPGTHVTEARNLIVYGNVAGTGPMLDTALGTANVPDQNISWQAAGSNPLINTVTIRVSGYQFRPLVTNVFGAQFPAITFNDISATMRSPL